MFEFYDIIDETWIIKRQAGKGSFSELYVAQNIQENNLVAIKVKNPDIESGVLKVNI